jgi:hypothetical protein
MPRISPLLRTVRRPGLPVALSLVYLLAVSGVMIWRGISRTSGIPVHYQFVIRADRAMFGGTDPSQ